MASNEYHRQYNIRRYHRLRAEYIEKLGGCCIDCGTVENLEFDHPDPRTKEFSIGRMLNVSKAKRDAEVAKCVLRCKPCHTEKSAINEECVRHDYRPL
jgi:hypothetical protein